jgi:hypothetical protein
MQAQIRSYVSRLCRELTRDGGAILFGSTPSSQRFGDAASPGTQDLAARIDHRHGLEDLPEDTVDQLDQFALAFLELVHTTTTGFNDASTWGTLAFTSRDVAGETGGYGTADLTTGTSANTGSGILVQQQSGTSATQDTYAPRLRRFECRVRPVDVSASLPNMRFAVGGFRTGAAQRLDQITDGVYFYLDTDAGGAGTYHAKITVNSVDTFDVDTGLSPRAIGTDVAFDFFRIDYDGATVQFYMGTPNEDDETVWSLITQTDEDLPGASNLVAGWGAGLMTEAALATGRIMVVDNILVKGLRVAV